MSTRMIRIFVVAATCVAAAAQADELPAYKLTVTDGGFEPSTLEVTAGQRFRLDVTNASKAPIEFESKPLKKEKIIAAGASTTLEFQALKPGGYKFVNEFRETEKAGQGEIVAH